MKQTFVLDSSCINSSIEVLTSEDFPHLLGDTKKSLEVSSIFNSINEIFIFSDYINLTVKGNAGRNLLCRRRTAKRDSQLVGVGGPAIPQILKQDTIMDRFQRTAGPVLQKRLDHEIDAVLKGVVK